MNAKFNSPLKFQFYFYSGKGGKEKIPIDFGVKNLTSKYHELRPKPKLKPKPKPKLKPRPKFKPKSKLKPKPS
jgi:hypothetical protein